MNKAFLTLILVGAALTGFAADRTVWQAASNGSLPEWSTPVGYSKDGQALYLARTVKAGVAGIGFFNPSESSAVILLASGSVAAPAFELWSGGGQWVETSSGKISTTAISAGKGADGRALPLLRVSYDGWLIPASYDAQERAALADIGGKRLLFTTFEVLMPDWTRFSASMDLRSSFNAGLANKDAAQNALRAAYGKGLHPGKYNAKSKKGYIPYGGKEVPVDKLPFEIFFGKGVWNDPDGDQLPLGAIPAGWDDDGSPLFLIKGKAASGEEALGKYNAARKEAYLSFGGKELPAANYRILCYDLSPNRKVSTLRAAGSRSAAPAVAAVQSQRPAARPQSAQAEGTRTEWGGGIVLQTRPEVEALTTFKAGPVRIVPAAGKWSAKGSLNDKSKDSEGFYVNSYSFEAKADQTLAVTVASANATPGVSILSPAGRWLNSRPLTGHGEFPMGGEYELNSVLPEKGRYIVLVWNNGEEGKADYSLDLVVGN